MAGLGGYLRTVPPLGWLILVVAVLVLAMIWDVAGGGAAGLYVGIVGVVVAVVAAIDARLSSAKVADSVAQVERAAVDIQATTRAVERADRLERIGGVEEVLLSIATADLFDEFGPERVGPLWDDLRAALARAAALDLPESEALALALLSYTDLPTDERGDLRRRRQPRLRRERVAIGRRHATPSRFKRRRGRARQPGGPQRHGPRRPSARPGEDTGRGRRWHRRASSGARDDHHDRKG